MTFQAYLDNIQARTGKTTADFRRLADAKGFLERGAIKPGIKAGQIVKWLRDEFLLGHGHAMAIYAVLKGAEGSGGRKKPAAVSRKKRSIAAPQPLGS